MKLIFDRPVYEVPVLIAYAVKSLMKDSDGPNLENMDKAIYYLKTYCESMVIAEKMHKNSERMQEIEKEINLLENRLKTADDEMYKLHGWHKFCDKRPDAYRFCEYLVSTSERVYDKGEGVFFPETENIREHFYYEYESEDVAAIVYWKYSENSPTE